MKNSSLHTWHIKLVKLQKFQQGDMTQINNYNAVGLHYLTKLNYFLSKAVQAQ